MKVGRQESLVGVHSPCSTSYSLSTFDHPDARSVCKLQIERLAAQVPVLAVWSAYNDPDRGKRQLVAHYTQEQLCAYPDMSYLELEVQRADSLAALQIKELSVEENTRAYVCLLSQQQSTPEYLLLLVQEPLSSLQQQCVEHAAQLLSHYLAVYRECFRQSSEIQLLEQVLQRSEHQLRNPLALIRLYAENLCLSLPEGAWQGQAMLIREIVSELSTTLKDLLSCGQQTKLRRASYDLRLILAESIKALQPWLEQKQLHVSYPSSSVTLAVDRWQMQQVFENLLSNAVYFSSHGETISWDWQVFSHEVLFQIRDQGPGLSQEELKQAFTPFYSQRVGGTGLGLAIAKKIILDHQGSIWGENLPEGGAQFSLTLPRSYSLATKITDQAAARRGNHSSASANTDRLAI